MRETCARVLAAALMTGAIGFAIGMPAIVGTAHNAGRSLTAPPSFLQRSVHVVASAPSRSARGGRLEETQSIGPASVSPAGRSGSTSNGSTSASSRHSTRGGRSELGPKPAPKPTPVPATRELASTSTPTAVSPPAPSQPAATPGKGKKKAKQHKSKGKPADVSQPPAATAPPQPANESAATDGEKDHGNGNDKGKDTGKDKGKNDDKGHDG
jgi:hypothetical protein